MTAPPIRAIGLRLLEAAGVGGLFILGYGFPAHSGHGVLEAIAAFLFPACIFGLVFRGRNLGWIFLGLFLGFYGVFHWVPRTVAIKGNLPLALGYLSGGLLMAWEALGLLVVAASTRWAHKRGGPWAAVCCASLTLLLWEVYGFHEYPWSLGVALGGLPWLARTAAFLSTHGLAALLWACAALSASRFKDGQRPWPPLAGPGIALGFLLCLSALWLLLPRGPQRELDVVMIQPNFDPELRRPGMERDMWIRSDAELEQQGLPKAGTATLLLWPESSVMGYNQALPNPRLPLEAQRRGIAWLFGTEGGREGDPYLTLNLARGEAAGQASFIQAKIEPLPFGERMPGPPFLRTWLDKTLGFLSQEPGTLSARSSFSFPTPQGALCVHPLLCSEALSYARARQGLQAAGGQLLANLTNDGWFERSQATDLHAAQIRMRAVEMGLPLVRATLTGKSGIFREDGSWVLWGEPMTEASYAFHLKWAPISTPARSAWLLRTLTAGLGLALAFFLFRRPGGQPV